MFSFVTLQFNFIFFKYFLCCPCVSARPGCSRSLKGRVRRLTLNVTSCWSRSKTRWRHGGSTGRPCCVFSTSLYEVDAALLILMLCITVQHASTCMNCNDGPSVCRQQEAPDLFDWLCIEELRLCCPPGRYGPQCKGPTKTCTQHMQYYCIFFSVLKISTQIVVVVTLSSSVIMVCVCVFLHGRMSLWSGGSLWRPGPL